MQTILMHIIGMLLSKFIYNYIYIMAVVDDLRPTSPKQLQSSEGTLIIEYTPSIARPMKEIELISTENIKPYKVRMCTFRCKQY
jgi:hypothetical protein